MDVGLEETLTTSGHALKLLVSFLLLAGVAFFAVVHRSVPEVPRATTSPQP